MRARPFDPVTGLLRPSASELNRAAHEAARAGSLLGPDVVSGGFGLHAVPPERFGLVLAKLLAASADAPYRYAWGAADVSPADRTVGEHVAGAYNGFEDAAGDWHAPAVDPLAPSGSGPRAAGDLVWLQWDEASRFWLIVGVPASVSPPVQVLRVLSTAAPGLSGYGMYPARVQAWVQLSPADPGGWQDASSTTVYVRDPNAAYGAAFMPGEYVAARYVEAFSGVGGAGDVYERVGLDGLWVDGPMAGLPFPGFAQRGYPETRHLDFNFPFYFQDPANPSSQPSPGRVKIGIAASTADSPGVLLGVPGGPASPLLGLPPAGGYGTDPWRQESNCQWARGGSTGFTSLMANIVTLSDGQPPTTGLPGQTPPDLAFAAWSSGGFATLGAGHGHFGLGVDGQGRLDVYSPGGTRGFAKWATAANPFNEFDVYTSALNVSAPGLNDLLVTFAGALEVTSGAAFCWVNAPHHANVTGIGNPYGSVTAQPQAGLLVTSPVKVSVGGIVELGFGSFSQTRMLGQNYVYPDGGPGPGTPGANLNDGNFPPSGRNGWVFYNGLYVGGLEWLLALRPTPGGSSLYTPPSVDMHMYTPPGYSPPPGPTYPTLNGGGFWSTLHVEYD